MISEFGACFNSEVCWREINQVLNEADKYLAHTAYWQYKQNKDFTTMGQGDYRNFGAQGLYDVNGQPQFYKIKALSRPYQRKTQGDLLS